MVLLQVNERQFPTSARIEYSGLLFIPSDCNDGAVLRRYSLDAQEDHDITALAMEQRKPPDFILEIFVDPTCARDVVRGVLHTIFFHRYFPSIRPSYTDVLDFTLPTVRDPELETLIDTRVGQLIRQLSSNSSLQSSIRGHLVVQFFEKKRRKGGGGLGWFTSGAKGEEEVCWERWSLEVTLATPKTEIERNKVTKAVGSSLQRTAMKILAIVNRDKDHIPPITTSENNPFPYTVDLNPRVEGWGRGGGIP